MCKYFGLGGNDVYVGRNQLDGASLDRFAVVYFDYDEQLEKNLVQNEDWAIFIQVLRKRLKQRQIKHIVSMRATIYGDRLIQADVATLDIFKQVVFKNLQNDDIKSIGTPQVSFLRGARHGQHMVLPDKIQYPLVDHTLAKVAIYF